MDAFDLLPKLVRAGIESDRKSIEAISLQLARKIKKDHPEIAIEISKALAYSGQSNSIARSLDLQPLPVDRETRFSLVKIDEPIEVPEPILEQYIRTQLEDFIHERNMLEIFLKEDVVPPNSILLHGQPGVGKTYIARWISYRLNLPLITLDLASSISSYLGRSGQNLRSIFDYVKTQDSVLFLDELDAIAKRRDDVSDLGELKRLVNVLLKELENCPSTCVIIGATNHPELLDKAIWRRFDRTLTITMPGEDERRALFSRHLGKLGEDITKDVVEYLSKYSKNINAADVCKMSEHIKRRIIIDQSESKLLIALSELFKIVQLDSREEKMQLCRKLKKEFTGLSQRDISQTTNIPLTSVSRYLSGEKEIQDDKR